LFIYAAIYIVFVMCVCGCAFRVCLVCSVRVPSANEVTQLIPRVCERACLHFHIMLLQRRGAKRRSLALTKSSSAHFHTIKYIAKERKSTHSTQVVREVEFMRFMRVSSRVHKISCSQDRETHRKLTIKAIEFSKNN